jgi:hypothetical protein
MYSVATTIEPNQAGRKRKRKTATVGFEIESRGGRHAQKKQRKGRERTSKVEKNKTKSQKGRQK